MSSIINTPQEIYYLIAQYELDLLDLGALIWSCKTLNERIGQDLPLQKCFLDNTPVMLRGPRSGAAIRRKYSDAKTAYGIMCNDPDGVLMSFPKLTPKEILKVLKVTNNRINREMGRQIIVDDVYKADADKVLDFLITSVIENATPEEKRASIVEILSLFFGAYVDVTQLWKDNNTVTKYVNLLKEKKTVVVLMKHIREQLGVMYGNILISARDPTSAWSNSNKKGSEVLAALLKLASLWPNFKFNLETPISSDNFKEFIPGYEIHPLEFCVAVNSQSGYKNLILNGVKPKPNAPYLPLALYRNKMDTIMSLTVEFLTLGNYDINKTFPDYLGFNRPTTILGYTVNSHIQLYHSNHQNNSFVEFLLNKGAKLTKEEEQEFLALEPTNWARRVAVLQQEKSYSSLTRKEKIQFDGRDSLEFANWRVRFLVLRKNGEFELIFGGNDYYGNWNQYTPGKLLCRSAKKRTNERWGSYGGYDMPLEPNSTTFCFHVFKMYDDTLSVLIDNELTSQDSYEEIGRLQPVQ